MNIYKQILNRTFDFFTTSSDFNGISLTSLPDEFGVPLEQLIDIVKELVNENKVSIQYGTNPHIIEFRHHDCASQIKVLEEAKSIEARAEKIGDFIIEFENTEFPICVYPSVELLKSKRDAHEIQNSPYTLMLSLATPQLKPVFFEIEVLERYFNDPRYEFKFKDYSGSISCLYDDNDHPIAREEDKIFLKTFGLGFDSNNNRLAVVYLRYLNGLTNEHQAFWKSKEAKGQCKVLKEYHESSIEGNRTFSFSIFSGFIGELNALNKLSKAIFKKQLFYKNFEEDNRPKELTFFFTPTLKNYNAFVLLLDQMISENIDKNFFEGTIELYTCHEIKEGIVERRPKDTLILLEEWLASLYTVDDKELFKDIFKIFKKIRKERWNPLHNINDNIFDKKYVEMQKIMVHKAYSSIRILRKIFQQHPLAENVEIPDRLDNGKIKMF